MLSHCKLLRKDTATTQVSFSSVPVSPKEADSHPNLIDAAITFSDLRKWLEKKISIQHPSLPMKPIILFLVCRRGRIYPVDGGMAATIKTNCSVHDSCFMSFSGLKNIINALDGLQDVTLENNIFIEALACEGGCVNGPQAETATSLL